MIESSGELVKNFGKNYESGTVLFEEGDSGKELYIIEKGEVQVSKIIGGKDQIVTTLDEGDFFGEMVLFGETSRTATVTTTKDSTIVVINEELFNKYIKNDAPILYLLLTKVCQRLISTTNELVKNMK